MHVSKSTCKTITLTCDMSYDEFVAYYNNCITMGLVNQNGSVTVNELTYKISYDKIYLCGCNLNLNDASYKVKIHLPKYITHIFENAFYQFRELTEICGEGIVYLGNYCFNNATRLQKVNFPKLTNIAEGAFTNCEALAKIEIPNCKKISTLAFQGCHSLKEINAPMVTKLGNSVFFNCYSLTNCYFNSIGYLNNSTFAHCKKLKVLNLSNIALGNIPCIEGKQVTNYELLLSSYKSLSRLYVDTFIGSFDKFHKAFYDCDLYYNNFIEKRDSTFPRF